MQKYFRKNSQRGFSFILLIFIVVVLLLFLFGGFMWLRSQKTPVQTELQSTSGAQPTVPVTDYAPGLPDSQKTEIIVRNADSTEQKIIFSTVTVDDFIKKLPPDEKVIERGPVSGKTQ